MNSKCRFVNLFSGFIDNSKCKISIWISFPNMIDQYCFCIITIASPKDTFRRVCFEVCGIGFLQEGPAGFGKKGSGLRKH